MKPTYGWQNATSNKYVFKHINDVKEATVEVFNLNLSKKQGLPHFVKCIIVIIGFNNFTLVMKIVVGS